MRKLHYKLRFNVVSYIGESKQEALGPHHSPEKLVQISIKLEINHPWVRGTQGFIK